MNAQAVVSNPFALMMNPEDVFHALKNSQALAKLNLRICRPLDKPMLACFASLVEIDAEIDAELDALDPADDEAL
ncbi:MAG: hypothetical protein JWP52_1709 [Rhizobacter sp.]|nr:hypothetical protein [Rhizobacter sp.]